MGGFFGTAVPKREDFGFFPVFSSSVVFQGTEGREDVCGFFPSLDGLGSLESPWFLIPCGFEFSGFSFNGGEVEFEGLLLVSFVDAIHLLDAPPFGLIVIKVFPDETPFGVGGKKLNFFIDFILQLHFSKDPFADRPRSPVVGKFLPKV